MNSITSASTAVNLVLRVETRRLPVRGYSPVVTEILPLMITVGVVMLPL